MNDYRSIALYMGAATQAAKLCSLTARIAQAHGAEIDALCPPDALPCEAVRKLLHEAGAQASCRGMPEGASALLEHARGADLLVLSQPYLESEHAASQHFASQLLVDTNCPVLFVPRPKELGTSCGTRVLVAWDGRRESARALRDALPLLQRAAEVSVRSYGHTGSSAARSLESAVQLLRRHGVAARHAVQRRGDADYAPDALMTPTLLDSTVGELLLSDAADLGADLLVMGAYGHSRAQEWMLGGVTRSMLSSMTVPVLMSH